MSEPLYLTGKTPDGTPLLGGMWLAKTQVGFPLDMSYEICRERGFLPDWSELLSDAGRVKLPAFELDSAVAELRLLIGELAEAVYGKWLALGEAKRQLMPAATFDEICQAMWEEKRDCSTWNVPRHQLLQI